MKKQQPKTKTRTPEHATLVNPNFYFSEKANKKQRR